MIGSQCGTDRGVSAPNPLSDAGIDRRTFIKACTTAAAAAGVSTELTAKVAEAVSSEDRPSVVWLHLQECTGCTETLLRTSQPSISELLLNLISLDYHETLCAAAGHQVEELLQKTIKEKSGKFVLIVEGSVPVADGGIYCKIAGKTALELLHEVAEHACAIVAMGSCASFGGVSASGPNPTGATGVPRVLAGKTVVTIPGCPPNPYNLLGVVLQYVTFCTLPELDELGRPAFAYGRTVHESCPRRADFDAARFAEEFGDEGHRLGYCLYKLGCKGPQTYANCSTLSFCEVPGAWPVGIGHPCVGCTEASVAFRVPMHDTIEIEHPTPPSTYAPITVDRGGVSPWATGFAGLVGGVVLGAAALAARQFSKEHQEQEG